MEKPLYPSPEGMNEMKYHRITSIEDPYFKQMHVLMQKVFPPEEVLEFSLWKEPVEDPGIRIFVAIHDGNVVGATEYRYYADYNVAMTDFTIIGESGLGIGPFLANRRMEDLKALASENKTALYGMFAEIYNPYSGLDHSFGGVKAMDPYVRREVLSHLGYKKLDFPYLHPSWNNDGEEVRGLDLCFMPLAAQLVELESALVSKFLRRYYSVLSNKPKSWHEMVENLEARETVHLLPI